MATTAKHFTKRVLGLVQTTLTTLGFHKRKAGILALQVSEEVLGTVGLNIATGRGADILEINPVIGVRNQRLERLVAELRGETFDELMPPTVAANLGYLSPENRYLPFIFTEDDRIETLADELREAVKAHGLPFITKAANLAALVHEMQAGRIGIQFMLDYRIPAGLFLLGDRAKAQAFLAARLAETSSRNDPAAIRYKAFASKFSERLAA